MKMIFEKKLKELISLYDRPEYQILLEKLKFYLKYQDKLQINEFNNLDIDTTEFEIAMNRLGIKILELETNYINDMTDLEVKFEDIKKLNHSKTVKKIENLKKIVNDKFNVIIYNIYLLLYLNRRLKIYLEKIEIFIVKDQ